MQLMLQLMRFVHERVCLCVCVRLSVYCVLAHSVQENQNGSHENQHPAEAAAAEAAASGKCKVNFVEGHASSSSRSIPWQPYTHPIGTVVFVFTPLYVCRHFVHIVWPDVSFRIEFSILRSCCCCIASIVEPSDGLVATPGDSISIKETAYQIEFSINVIHIGRD